eukprot:s109_g4.t1
MEKCIKTFRAWPYRQSPSASEQSSDCCLYHMASGDGAAGDLPAEAADPDAEELELFGSEEEEEKGVKELFGDDDEGEELELFGSEEEPEAAEQAPSAPSAPAAQAQPPSVISELDEKDIFGDFSDDEPEKELSIDVTERMMPAADKDLISIRLPNMLSFDDAQYLGMESITDTLMEGYKEYKNTRGQNVVSLQNPENCVRWRLEQDEYGNNVLDSTGRPVHESNCRLVQWEDETWTLFVGDEPFHITEVAERNPIFEVNSQDVYVCHGAISNKLIATPRSMESASHDMLKKSQYRKHEPVRRSLLMTETETAEARQVLDMERENRKLRESRQKRALGDTALPAMTAGFLEDDQSVHGPSIADLKRQYREEAGRPAKRPKQDESPSPTR